jgi:phenylacetate-coenzyme A ligase PaaK-like adenylate-forming protein
VATTTAGTGFERLRASVQAELLARVPDQIERLRWSREQIEAAQRDGLRALLARAIESSPFHRRRLAGIDPSRFELADLSSLPVMTKAEMMEELDAVFTDGRLSRGLVERALAATAAEPVPILGEYAAVASGGCSGQRGLFVFDREALVGGFSSLSRWQMARMLALGGPPPGGLPIVLVGAASAVHLTGAAPAWTAGEEMPFRFIPVPVTLPLAEIVERLNSLLPPVLYSYASMLARLAAERRAGRLRIAPMAVATTSETLTPQMRAATARAFGVPIVDIFGSSEGLVGTSAPDDEVLVFNSDLCIAELVDDQNRPVPPGVPSAKVLLTNLYNLTQPLIRYELTDSFVRQPHAADHGHLRAQVRGRADEVLSYEDVDVHPHVVRSVLVTSPEILDYQVRQTPGGMDVEALAVVNVDGARLAGRLAKALAEAGLHDPAVTVRIVDHLERNPETGKLRRFVSRPAPHDRTGHGADTPAPAPVRRPPPQNRAPARPLTHRNPR